jgi:hypothetical protein
LGRGAIFGRAYGFHQVTLCYVCELAYAPVEHGKLLFDCMEERWVNPHADARVQRLAASYLEVYRARQSVNECLDANEKTA